MKKCPFCSELIQDTARKCRFCGEFLEGAPPAIVQAPAQGTRTSTAAIASMILGFIGIFFFPLFLVAFILGIAALSKIKASRGALGGKGMAITGIVLGGIGFAVVVIAIVAAIAIPSLLVAKKKANEAAVRGTLEYITQAQEMHYSANGVYAGDLAALTEKNYLDKDLAGGEKHGYCFTLVLDDPDGHSWHATAEPVESGSGDKFFYVDNSVGIQEFSHPLDSYPRPPDSPWEEPSEPSAEKEIEPPPPAKPEPKKQPIVRKVRVKLSAETWRGGEPFDIGGNIKDKLEALGVGMTESEEDEVDAVLLIEMTESQGAGYAFSPFSEPTGWGTNFSCAITLLDAETAETLFTYHISSLPPSTVNMMNIYGESLASFTGSLRYEYLPAMLATRLGVESAYPVCLSALQYDETREIVLELLEQADYKPANVKEATYLAIAEEDFSKCVELGEEALEPLIQYYHLYREEASYDAPSEALMQIPGIIAGIGGKRAAKALRDALVEFKNSVCETSFFEHAFPENRENLVNDGITVIEAVAKVGDEFSLPILSEIAEHVKERDAEEETGDEELDELAEEVIAAIEKAIDAIKGKLKQK